MTRGKHGQAKAVLREAAEQEAELGTYQRKIVELLAQIKKAEEALAESEQRRHAQVTKLRQQLHEGISPALAVVERENRTLRAERDHFKRRVELLTKMQGKIFADVAQHGKTAHGLSHEEAEGWALVLLKWRLDDDPGPIGTQLKTATERAAVTHFLR